jgi:thioredoxin reductase (NADPH)
MSAPPGAGGAPAGERLDLLVVGGGPTGIAIGAEAKRDGLQVLVVERGPLLASLLDYPVDMTFFTTRERLEIAGIPFAVPEEKPDRRQAIAYYQAVADRYSVPVATHEEVTSIERLAGGGGFAVGSAGRAGERRRLARAVALATGYFTWPRRLGVPGEDRPWVCARYREPWAHHGERVLIVGGGNSAAEAALDLHRHGAGVTLVVRGDGLKETIKYWVRPDLENRIAEGSIAARFRTRVRGFGDRHAEVESPAGIERLAADAVYVLIGYRPDTRLLAGAGVPVDPLTAVPEFDPETCETPVAGLYVAGTVQAGLETHRIFIENSRDHGPRIVAHLAARLRRERPAPAA